METYWLKYIYFLDIKTTLPIIALILSTAASFFMQTEYYADAKDAVQAFFIGLLGSIVVFVLLWLLQLCQKAFFPSWWETLSAVCAVIIGIIVFFYAAAEMGLLAAILAYIAGLITDGLVFYFGKYILIPFVKYVAGYGLFHGIILVVLPVLMIIVAINAIDQGTPIFYLLLFSVLAIEIFFLFTPIIPNETKTLLYKIIIFFAPFVVSLLLLTWRKTLSLWFSCAFILLGSTVSQAYLYKLDMLLGLQLQGSMVLCGFIVTFLLVFYLNRISHEGEFSIHELPILSLLTGTLLNATLIIFFISKEFSLEFKAVLACCSAIFGAVLLIGRYHILRKRLA